MICFEALRLSGRECALSVRTATKKQEETREIPIRALGYEARKEGLLLRSAAVVECPCVQEKLLPDSSSC